VNLTALVELDLNIYHILRSLVYFEEADNQPNLRLIGTRASWEEMRSSIETEVKKVL
jgi:hypothetical protein